MNDLIDNYISLWLKTKHAQSHAREMEEKLRIAAEAIRDQATAEKTRRTAYISSRHGKVIIVDTTINHLFDVCELSHLQNEEIIDASQ